MKHSRGNSDSVFDPGRLAKSQWIGYRAGRRNAKM
jgi:hypothetical protein